jgi:iron complex outermembrane receptor protein
MMKKYRDTSLAQRACITAALAAGFSLLAAAQEAPPNPTNEPSTGTSNTTIVVTAPREAIPLRESPSSTQVVGKKELDLMPRSAAADEALKLVPGLKIDNQADGERVHLSIRGQGILTESGIRGIKVLIDGIPLNDPTGYAPDLFDVIWSSVARIEVLKGPAAALYGGGAAGGVINIITREPETDSANGGGELEGGSYLFRRGEAYGSGTQGNLGYAVTGQRMTGNGYRDHTAFRASNLYSKFHWQFGSSFSLTAIAAGTDFFNQNAEGLNSIWLAEDRRQANPDAITYNEYQLTKRGTGAVSGHWQIAAAHDLDFSTYYRHTQYTEAVPSSVIHRDIDTPGATLMYTWHAGQGSLKNHLSFGVDADWQDIDAYTRPNLGGAVEGTDKLSDNSIHQRSAGFWAQDRVELNPRWALVFAARNDDIHNELNDNLKAGGMDLSGSKSFTKTTGRAGVTFNPLPYFGLYASWGQGFMPPNTEQLVANPLQIGGFNQELVPAESQGEEVGARGAIGKTLSYDVALYHLTTDNEYQRYRVTSRPLETFYRNAGSTRRNGLELALAWRPVPEFRAQLAYTYCDFIYTTLYSAEGLNESGNYLPNTPKHQGYLDLQYDLGSNWSFGAAAEMQSRAYVDFTNIPYIGGYTLYHARVGYKWKTTRTNGEVMLFGRNLGNKEYIAFTEPDPDGNSYQPAPERELFLQVRIAFGR